MLEKIGIITVILMLAAVSAACSGSDDDPTKTPSVQSQSGLSVAFALQAGQRARDRSTRGDTSQGAAAPSSETVGDSTSRSAGSLRYSFSNDGLTVTGYGMATANADSAILELYFSTSSSYPRSATGSDGTSSSGSSPDSQTTPEASPRRICNRSSMRLLRLASIGATSNTSAVLTTTRTTPARLFASPSRTLASWAT